MIWLFVQHRVLYEKAVLDTFHHTHTPIALVASPQRNRERGEALIHLREESTGRLHLEGVFLLQITLEDGRPPLRLLRLSFAGTHHDVETDDVIALHRRVLHLLIVVHLV